MINKIAILGAGTMGQGLARLFVKHGLQTILYEPVHGALAAAKNKLHVFLNSYVLRCTFDYEIGLARTFLQL